MALLIPLPHPPPPILLFIHLGYDNLDLEILLDCKLFNGKITGQMVDMGNCRMTFEPLVFSDNHIRDFYDKNWVYISDITRKLFKGGKYSKTCTKQLSELNI